MDPKTILIVDDDPYVRDAIADTLTPEGYAVQTAQDGQQALELLSSGTPPALILLDLRMPTLDGLHFRTVQRQTPAIADIPVVVLTADGAAKDNWPGLTADQILMKPIDREQLLSAVQKHC